MFAELSSLVLGAMLLSAASAAPATSKRATLDPSIFNSMQRCADLSSAAYSECSEVAFDVTITKVINQTLTSTQGFIGYSDTYKTIDVVMTGSTDNLDFVNDVDVVLVTPKLSGVDFPQGVQIMNGIYSPWASVHQQVITEVSRLIDLYPDYSLKSTGHSLGGSLTYLSYIALVSNFPTKNVTSSPLNAYPIGNEAFADFGTSLNGTIRRGTDCKDGVPNMYNSTTAQNFYHYGTEYFSCGSPIDTFQCQGERDTSCSAGDGCYGVTVGHYFSFGVLMESVGCGTNATTSRRY